MLSSAIENKSASVSAGGTQNIPPSAIPSRCKPFYSDTSKIKRAINTEQNSFKIKEATAADLKA